MNIKATLAIGLIKIVGRLPLCVNRLLGYTLGWLWGILPTREKRIVSANVAHCYPSMNQKQQRHFVKECLKQNAMTLCELPWVWQAFRSPKYVLKVSGMHYLQALKNHPNGGIVIGPHLGNWEVVGQFVTQHIGGTVTLYRPPKIKELETIVVAGRSQGGNTLLPASLRGVSGVLKHLRKGGVSCILPDQIPHDPSAGIVAPFFKQPALTMTLISNLVSKTQCTCVYISAIRIPRGFHIICEPASEALYSEDLQESVTTLNQGVEQAISHCPEQYQWAYKRFRKQADGANIYRRA